MTINSLSELPPELLLRISRLLDLKDALALRLACQELYKVSICPGFLKRWNLRPMLPRDTMKFVEMTNKLDKAKDLMISLEKINEQSVHKVLPFLTNAKEISVEVKHLRTVVVNCPNIQKLTLFDLSRNDDFSGTINESHVKAFKDLQNLSKLEELSLVGGMNIFSLDALAIFVKSAPGSVTTISLKSLRLSYDSTCKFWSNVPKSVKHWRFKDVWNLSKINLTIPGNVLSLYIHSCDGIVRLTDIANPQLEKLTLFGKCARWEPFASFNWNEINFNHLQFLQVSRACDKFDHTWKEGRCKLWEFVNMNNSAPNTVTHLTISECTCGDDDVQKILTRFQKLQFLTVADMPNITPALLANINHNALVQLTVKNCDQLSMSIVKQFDVKLSFKLSFC